MPEAEQPPLPREDAFLVFDSVAGTHAVLVGGQAVAFWADRYRAQIPELVEDPTVFVSSDVDFLGGKEDARACSIVLGGQVYLQDAPFDSIPINAAQVVFVDSIGETRKIDFLINLCGTKRADEIVARAVLAEIEEGRGIQIMDPITCLRTRLANISRLGLGRTDAKSLQQARVAVWAAREWLRDAAMLDQKEAKKAIEALFAYALHHDHAQEAALVHGIEAFDAITPDPRLPERFHSIRFPQMQDLIEKSRARTRGRRVPTA
jgi:hypothetical protein